MPPRKKTPLPTRAPLPKDRLGKMPRQTSITVPLDDSAVEAFEAARAAHDGAVARLGAERGRRVNQRRAADITAEQHALEALVDAEIDAELDPLRKALHVAEQAVRDTSRTFTFRALGRAAYQELLDAHKPQEEDHEDVRSQGIGQRAAYHAATFAPALIQASSIDPELSDEDIAEIFAGDTWNHQEIAQLFMAALQVNTQRRVVELPK